MIENAAIAMKQATENFLLLIIFMVIPRKNGAKKPRAFTLVELLVVIGIIAVLTAILLPVIYQGRRQMLKIKCAAQLRQIGAGVQLYANAYKGALHYSKGGTKWLANTSGDTALISNSLSTAYWGVAYAPMLIPSSTLRLTGPQSDEIVRAAFQIWHCPSTVYTGLFGNEAEDAPITYGINGYVAGSSTTPTAPSRYRKLSSYKNPASVVLAEDSIVQVVLNAGSTLSSFDAASNLLDFRPGGARYGSSTYGSSTNLTTQGVNEYFRHHGQTNLLWLDGHVESVSETLGQDIPSSWYTARL